MTTSPHPLVIIGAGQSSLAAARAARHAGLSALILEAASEPGGSWPHYYDSLTAFSPARFSAMPGLDFPGDPDHYPHRDEVTAYLRRYAATLDVEIRTGTRAHAVQAADDGGFTVRTADGQDITAAAVIAAGGSFTRPIRPSLPGAESFTGQVLHAADYRGPKDLEGRRVVVVGGGNSAVQIACELAIAAGPDGPDRIRIASRAPLTFLPQRREGRDVHHWLTSSGFDDLPPAWLLHRLPGRPVMDTGDHAAAVASGRLVRRPMFTALDGEHVVWADGTRERVDAVLTATGYLPDLGYLAPLGALDEHGLPLHAGGLSLTHPGLAYLGLEFQRSFASNTLRGVAADAAHVMGPLAAHVRDAPARVGL
ncbi:FAD-dependent oxidoreductase [Spongiactinospora sp. TRM90649]|uniref:flavin-containing monooxygenase n=1 Tax=Spongiactinospora sp. TRM90649 TaxID=3031114 RepID=UPI0023F757CE|nr:FAD-dependent oxidoreductase [Spongiactinospora sp. TRM90649]MDF5759348.1 NAD(P)-binding domain-containing protein [Spongiactinospora sp. TRM90649]